MMIRELAERLAETDQITGDQFCSLVDQLVEGVLSVSSGLAPNDRPGLIADGLSIQVYVLAVTFHLKLLKIGRKAFEVVGILHYNDTLPTEKVVVPDGQQAHQCRQVLL